MALEVGIRKFAMGVMIPLKVFFIFKIMTLLVIFVNLPSSLGDSDHSLDILANDQSDHNSGDSDKEMGVEGLSAYEKYRDLFILTSENFTEKVYGRQEPWIVIFHENGQILTGWKTMASSVRGMIWIGVVNKAESSVLSSQGIDVEKIPTACVYPHGSKHFKKKHVRAVSTPLEAKNIAVQSLPDNFIKITGNDMKDFFMESFMTSPSKFPAVLVNENKIISPVFKAIALRFKKYFNFGLMINPSSSDLASLGLQDHYFEFPSFFILVTTDSIEPKVNAVLYKPDEMGEVNYPNLMKFLFYVNGEFRFQLPGENMSDEETESKMLDIRSIEEERFQFVSSESKGYKKEKSEL